MDLNKYDFETKLTELITEEILDENYLYRNLLEKLEYVLYHNTSSTAITSLNGIFDILKIVKTAQLIKESRITEEKNP